MKVSQLIKKLQKCDQDADVITASDPEGNSFHILDSVTPERFYSKEDGNIEHIADEEGRVELEVEGIKGFKKAIILWP